MQVAQRFLCQVQGFADCRLISLKQGLTLTLTHSPLESKVGLVESKKCQLTKNTCPIRKVVFYSLESSFWLVEN